MDGELGDAQLLWLRVQSLYDDVLELLRVGVAGDFDHGAGNQQLYVPCPADCVRRGVDCRAGARQDCRHADLEMAQTVH